MIEITLVGNVSRHVAGLRFDDRQRGQRTVAVLLADAGGAFEQPAVQVEHVARIRFAAGRAPQDQRNLAVGHGVFGEIVVDDQRIPAVVHEPFTHRRAGKRREVLAGGGIGGRRRHDDGVRHGAGLFEHGDEPGDVGLLLADGDVDAVQRAVVLVARASASPGSARLVDDRVDADGRLAGGAVADDQLALAAADRDHRVDRHDAGLHRLADGRRRMMPGAIFSTG